MQSPTPELVGELLELRLHVTAPGDDADGSGPFAHHLRHGLDGIVGMLELDQPAHIE